MAGEGAGLDYWSGLVSGFQGKREETERRNYEREVQNRQFADRVFSWLLNSRDPQMQELALQGMAEPITKQKGMGGYLGKFQSDPFFSQVISRANEMIPDDTPDPRQPTLPPASGPAPPSPGAAAMPTNQPVRAGSEPIQQLPGQQLAPEPPPPPPQTDYTTGVEAPMPPDQPGMGGPAEMDLGGGAAGPMGAPPAPPVSKYKRRGTGVPTAEEIAEMQARIPLETRLALADKTFAGRPDLQQRAQLGVFGTPSSPSQFDAQSFGVKLPNGNIVPVSQDKSTGKFVLADGTPFDPNTMTMVRMTGGGGGLGTTSDKVPDTPASRQMLIQMGADPSLLTLPHSPTGYLEYKMAASGEMLVGPAMFVPPPAFSSTPTILDAAGNATVAGVPRGGGTPVPIANAPNPQPSTEQSAAQALLATVKANIAAAEAPRLPRQPKRPLGPAARDKMVRDAAVQAGLPYTTYFELEQATRVPTARQVAPHPNAPAAAGPTVNPPATDIDKFRQRAMERDRQLRGGGPMGQPPQRPPVRSSGPGPGPAR